MAVKITDHTGEVKNSLDQKANIFLRLFAEAVVLEAEPNTPQKLGNLRRDVVKSVLGLQGKIAWGKNYAKFQETKQYRRYTTPGTGPHFAENAIKAMIRKSGDIGKKAGLIIK